MSDDKKGFKLFTKAGGTKASNSAMPSLPRPKDVKKRWIYVLGGFLVVAGVGSSLLKEEKKAPVKREQPVGVVDVNPQTADKREWQATATQQMADLAAKVQRLTDEQQKKDEQLRALQEEVKKKSEAAEKAAADAKAGNGKNQGALTPIGGGVPQPPTLPPQLQTPASTGGTPVAPPSFTPPPAGTASPAVAPAAPQGKPMEFKGPQADGEKPVVEAKTTFRKNENVGRVPLSFAKMSLLNGIDAGTSQTTQSNPLPVLISINDHAQLPGLAKYKLKGCFAMGTGYGDLSAERVYIRVSRLSCVDKSNGLVLSQEVGGYINDSDGTLGLRGVVQDRQGARLGKALLAGFAQGLAGALGSAQSTTSSSSLTGSVTSSITGSAALRASGLSGAQTAANQLAEFYLKEAQNIFPVIAVENGRTGTLVLTSDSKLEWFNNRDQYISETTPTKK